MRRLVDGIALTLEEAAEIASFINMALESDWDRYTDHVITRESHETGVRRMNPELYDMAQELYKIL